MPRHSAELSPIPEYALHDHLAAAERALREVARTARSKGEEVGAKRNADLVARIQREFHGRPLSEGAVGTSEAVAAVLAGTDALQLQGDREWHGANPVPVGSRRRGAGR